MELSDKGLTLIKDFESCRLTAYPDTNGVPTIGYGHTAGVKLGATCTQDQADEWLREDAQSAINTVNRLVTVLLSQSEFDALCSFVFNVGSGNFRGSTLLKLLNQGKYTEAAEQFKRWDKDNGKVVAGLLRRRLAEESEFKEDLVPK